MQIKKTIAWLGWYRDTPVAIKVSEVDAAAGYALVSCFECKGTGWWGYGPSGTEGPCSVCKGTGKNYINC